MPPPATSPRVSKLSKVLAALADGRDIDALRIAAKFHDLGAEKVPITRAWAAHNHPQTYADMGHNPAALVAAGLDAIRRRYGV
jgi:hypothetical protein